MAQVYDRSQEWTDENRTCPSMLSPSAVQDAKEVTKTAVNFLFKRSFPPEHINASTPVLSS